MRSAFHRIVMAALTAGGLLVAPHAFGYTGNGHIDSGGGLFAGSGYSTVTTLGFHTSGPSASAEHAQQEGFLVFYGQPFLTPSAAYLDFGGVDVGDSRTLLFTLWNYGGVGLLLTDLRLASEGGAGFSIEGSTSDFLLAPGSGVEVRIRFEPPAEGALDDTFSVQTNDPIAGVWRLPVSGAGVTVAPQMGDLPGAVELGPVPVDSVASHDVPIANLGGGDLHVGRIAAEDGAFLAVPDTVVVPPGEERVVDAELKAALVNLPGPRWVQGYLAGIGGTDVDPEIIENIIRDALGRGEPLDRPIWINDSGEPEVGS